jgi:hypothetical protein
MSSIPKGCWAVTVAIEGQPCQVDHQGINMTESYKDEYGDDVSKDYCCPSCAAEGKEYKYCFYCGEGPRVTWLRFHNSNPRKEWNVFSMCQECTDAKRAQTEKKGPLRQYCASCKKIGTGMRRVGNLHYCSHKCRDKPLILSNEGVAHVCSGCQKVGALQRCSRCKEKYYCSVECQKTDWVNHKVTCCKR